MMHPCEELLILKSLVKMYEIAMSSNEKDLMFQISVDIAESAEQLEKLSMDLANTVPL